ncbi:DUF4349 domain-containing protein [Nocardia sp. KC 131]|uniref:DUF4349 domain-containing protein n=1 Tax=Nocardia arseniciresistens TaxID=3392119 RepID=UPI00398F5133
MRKLAVVLTGLLGLTLLVGCGDDDSGSSARGGSSMATAAAPAIAPPGFREQTPVPKQDNRGQGSEPITLRKEVVTGSVSLTAGDPVGVAGKVADQVRLLDGRVDSRSEQPGTDDIDPSATLTVRVPADKTDKFIDVLGDLGRITQVSTNRDDVTMQWQDLDARIKALQTTVDRLRALIAGASNTADLIAAENALSSRQGELDSLTAQKRHLDDQVALSTLTIDITTADKKSDDGPSNFWDGIVSGWHSLVDWLKDAVVFTGKAVPWLGFLVVIVAVVWGIVRIVRRPRKETGAASTTPATTTAGATTAEESAAQKESAAETKSAPEPDTSKAAGTGAAGADSGKGDDKTQQP